MDLILILQKAILFDSQMSLWEIVTQAILDLCPHTGGGI